MTYRAQVEFCVNVQTFRNIDLTFTGYYCFKLKLYQKTQNDEEILAFPYAIQHTFKPENIDNEIKPSDPNDKLLNKMGSSKICSNTPPLNSHIKDKECEAYTTPILISHIEEEAEIQELIQFRAEVDVFPMQNNINNAAFFQDIDMIYFDNQSKTTNNLDKSEIFVENKDPNKKVQKIVSSLKFELRNSAKGIHEYIQGNFIENYYSILNLSVHTVNTDFRFRSIEKHLSRQDKTLFLIR